MELCMKKNRLNDYEKRRFVDIIRKYPIIWNKKHPNRFRNDLKLAWQNVAKEMNENEEVCRLGWKSICDSHRYLKRKYGRKVENGTTEQGYSTDDCTSPKTKYNDDMDFMIDPSGSSDYNDDNKLLLEDNLSAAMEDVSSYQSNSSFKRAESSQESVPSSHQSNSYLRKAESSQDGIPSIYQGNSSFKGVENSQHGTPSIYQSISTFNGLESGHLRMQSIYPNNNSIKRGASSLDATPSTYQSNHTFKRAASSQDATSSIYQSNNSFKITASSRDGTPPIYQTNNYLKRVEASHDGGSPFSQQSSGFFDKVESSQDETPPTHDVVDVMEFKQENLDDDTPIISNVTETSQKGELMEDAELHNLGGSTTKILTNKLLTHSDKSYNHTREEYHFDKSNNQIRAEDDPKPHFNANSHFLNHLDSILNKLPLHISENLQGKIMGMAYAELAKHRSKATNNKCDSNS
uniref:MADF domain-containing protein n=1 Tax=Musca domestica TaxID=7370 RepID=A0A1I8M5L6_MUSDO